MQPLPWLLLAAAVIGLEGCARQADVSTTPTPPPVVEEVLTADVAGRQENAWSSGARIDWGHVAPGGSNSASNRGTTSITTSGSSGNSGSRGTSGNSGISGSVSGTSGSVSGITPQPVSRSELRDLSEELFRLDVNAVGSLVTLAPQGRTSSASDVDNAPNKLFASVSPRAFSGPTYERLLALLDNYEATVTVAERDTPQERQEQNAFLDAVMSTSIMARTQDFLRAKGFISGSLKDTLREIWFTPYSRSRRTVGSSGFEHVFVGETKSGEVSGFHNWINFYRQEQLGKLDYFGHMRTVDLGEQADIILLKFKWEDETKPFGSMFVGTSPELDMALFTVCFYARPGLNCPIELAGNRLNIKTYQQTYRGHQYIGTAFPNI